MGVSDLDLKRRNEVLTEWVGQRVMVRGVFEKLVTKDRHGRDRVVVLAQDVEIELPTKARHDIGHAWIQKAETMKWLQPGDRFEASCRVDSYTKEDGLVYRNLVYPHNVRRAAEPPALRLGEIPNGASNGHANGRQAPPPPQLPPPPPPPNPLVLLARGKNLVGKIGLDHLHELGDFVDDLGGWDRFQEFLGLLG